jgi:transposase InsO family protein
MTKVTCHGSFIQPRPEPGCHLRLLAQVEQSPGARNVHRVQRVGRLRWSGAGQTRREVQVALFEYISGFSNLRRIHSALGWKRPVAFERKAA